MSAKKQHWVKRQTAVTCPQVGVAGGDFLDLTPIRHVVGVLLLVVWAAGCAGPAPPAGERAAVVASADSQHAGITTPHGDHSPHHGGLVLMHGELHYEVVLDRDGRHAVWFSDAMREELPASVASKVEMTVMRPNAAAEALTLTIDESGESWIAAGQPIAGDGVMVTVRFLSRGEPLEIEIPFAPPAT